MQKDTYMGLKAPKNVHTVTTEEVEQQLEQIRLANAKIEIVTDRPAQLGDEVVIDYAGFVGEEQFEGGTAQMQPLTLGSGTFIPGFEDQLVGAETGSQVDVHVTFPEVYHAEELAGKEAVFHCTVHGIRTKVPYPMDDSFAQGVAKLDTLEQMKEVLRAQMQASADEQCYNRLVDALLYSLSQACDIQPEPAAIEREIDNMMLSLEQQVQQQGASMEQYLAYTGRTMQELRETQREQAKYGAKIGAALDVIADLEGITATDEDMDREFENIAKECGISVEQVRGFFSEDSMETVRQEIRQKKAVGVIIANADITTVEV